MNSRTNAVTNALAAGSAAAAILIVSQAAAADDESGRTIAYQAAPQHVEFIDLGAPGPSPGDQHTFTNDLSIDGRKVGHDGGSCINVRVTATEIYVSCALSVVLPEGQLTLQFSRVDPIGAPPSEPFTGAVTGGTGAFTGAGGTAQVDVSDPQVHQVVVTLR